MAKFEEADPRWKVKDLGDAGKNVNAWHWTESDCLPWFKQEFESKFDGDDNKVLSCSMDGGSTAEMWCYKLDQCTGEAHINRRKGNKVMVLYELELKIKWKAVINGPDGEEKSSAKGHYHMPSLDTVDAIDDFEINTKFNKDTKEAKEANQFAKTSGAAQVRRMIVESIKKLQADAGVGVGGSAKNLSSSSLSADSSGNNSPAPAPKPTPPKPSAPTSSSSSSSSSCEDIEVEVNFNAPAKEVFECFTVPQRVMAYTQSRAEVGTQPGQKLVLFDGSITGEIVACTENEKLVWLWRQSSWAPGKNSTVTLTFNQAGPGNTKVKLVQKGVPSSDVHGNSNMKQVVEEGWKRNLFDRIKMVYGYGVPSFS